LKLLNLLNKVFPSAEAALQDIVADGQLMAVGGFGLCGIPEALIDALDQSTIICGHALRPTPISARGIS
jgi:acyl CoA:acetate/3-ketoacid CoA transferase